MNRRTVFVYALAGLLITGGLYYFLREETGAPDAASPQNQPKQEVLFEKSALIEEQDGKKLWEISAEAINLDVVAKKVYLTNVKAVFYRDDGSSVNIIAHKGVADTASKEIVLEGEVTAVSSTDGASFAAPTVRWAGNIRWFFADGGVKITRDDTVMTGDKLDSDVDMQQMKIRGNAKMVRGGGA